MRSRFLPAACLALALLGLAAGLYGVHFPPGPRGDEATYVLMVQSLWHDHDLAYDQRDLLRGYQVWNRGPSGLTLFTPDGGRSMYFGEPFAYALAALPFYALLGVQGVVVLNMALFLVCAGAAWWFFRARGAGVLLAGFFFASAAFGYVFRLEPAVFTMACLFFPLLLWRKLRRRPIWGRREDLLLALAGMLLSGAILTGGPAALLGLPIAVDLGLERRFRGLLVLVGSAVLAFALAGAMQRHWTGTWSPYRAPRRSTFTNEFPIESRRDVWQLRLPARSGPWSAGPGQDLAPRLLARNAGYFLAGRYSGVLPYFPFALLALGLYLAGPRDRAGHLLLAAVAGYCLFILLLRPFDWRGSPDDLGDRAFALVYPALVFLPGHFRLRRPGLALLPFAAAGLWTVPALAMPVPALAHEPTPQEHVRAPAFRALPLELTLLAGHDLDGWAARTWGQAVWIVPRESFFVDEPHPNGVWVRGASRSEVVMVSPTRVRRVRLVVYSLAPENELTLDSGEERVRVRFDSEAKRNGTPIDLKVAPAARNLGFFAASAGEFVYRLTVTSTDGLVPARRDPNSPDLRYLGTFLDFTGRGL